MFFAEHIYASFDCALASFNFFYMTLKLHFPKYPPVQSY